MERTERGSVIAGPGRKRPTPARPLLGGRANWLNLVFVKLARVV